MHIAYLVNQYPKVSHTFIRREILALEARGVQVSRFALRGWDAETPDSADAAERERTRYVLAGGLLPLLAAAAGAALREPRRFARALRQAWQTARGSDRPWPLHLVYLAEACWLLPRLRAAGAEHLHAHFGTNPAEVAMLLRALGGPPYSFTAHGPEEFDQPAALGIARKIEHARFVLAVSSYGRSQLWRWARPQDWRKVHVLHCGLDAAFLGAAPTPVPGSRRLVCVGRLCAQKGQLLLVEAAAQAMSRDGAALHPGAGRRRRDAPAGRVRDRPLRARRPRSDHRLVEQRGRRRPTAAGRRAGAADLRRGAAGGHHGSDGAGPAGAQHLRRRHPGAGARRAGRLAVPRRQRDGSGTGDAGLPAIVHGCAVRDGRNGRQRVAQRHNIDVEVAKLIALVGGPQDPPTPA